MVNSHGDPNSLTAEFARVVLHDLLADLAVLNAVPERSLRRDQLHLQQRSSEGLFFFTKVLPSLGKSLDKALAGDRELCTAGFATRAGLPRFLEAYWEKVFHPGGALRESPNTAAIRAIRQVSYLFYKLEVPFKDEELEMCYEKFVAIDGSLPHLDSEPELSCITRAVVDDARELIGRLFLDRDLSPTGDRFDPRAILPKHGPGAVATGEPAHRKYRFARFFERIDKEYPYTEYFYFNYSHLCDRLTQFLGLTEGADELAKLVCVPKDSRGPRLISMEPLEFQWIQQGLGKAMTDWLESHPLTKGFVNFSDQSVNRDLARIASMYGEFDTLDMKDASDRVSHWLVKELFPPHVYRKLSACRTTGTVLPDGRTVVLNKFAPMGSALCFPVESLVFWALGTAILNRSGEYIRSDKATMHTIRIYGDDMIVPSGALCLLRPIFTELHLEFNEDKCCTGRFFRESCGFDAFRGESVTPIRIKQLGRSPAALLSVCAYARAFAQLGCPLTAAHLYGVVESETGHLPYSSDGTLPLSRWICSAEAAAVKNLAFEMRLNADLQRWEFASLQPIARRYRSGWSGWEELLRIFRPNRTDQLFQRSAEFESCYAAKVSCIPDAPPQQCEYVVPRSVILRKTWTVWQ